MERGAPRAREGHATNPTLHARRASIRVGIDARLRAYRGGGIAEHVTRLIAGLRRVAPAELGVDVRIIEHRKRGAAPHFQDVTGDSIAPITPITPVWTPPHHRLEGLALPIELALRGKLDLLHCPDVVIPWAWRGPAVVTVHDVAFLRRPELLTMESRRYYGQIHASIRRARRVIVVSDYTRRELLALTDVAPDKVVVVPNAVAPRYLETSPHGAIGALDDPDRATLHRLDIRQPYLLFVSTIEPRKNVPVLLEAFRALIDAGDATWRGEPVDLLLAGGDGWKSEAVYERANALRLGKRARFLGWVDAADLAPLYRGARLLAHPAIDEGFGLTPLEAMACGTPVVVSRAGSLPEVVGEAGELVDAEDPTAWADALARLLADDPARTAHIAAGRARASAFTIERQARGTAAVYRAAVA